MAETAGSPAGERGESARLRASPLTSNLLQDFPRVALPSPHSVLELLLVFERPLSFQSAPGVGGVRSGLSVPPFQLPRCILLEEPGLEKVGVVPPSPMSPRPKTQREAAATLPLWPRPRFE